MVDTFSKYLDQMMGKDRDAISKSEKLTDNFNSPDVCKYALVSFCPHELFPNTKFDMGPCKLRHDELFKKQFSLLDDEEKRNHFERIYIDDTISKLLC